jgi:hypothetical protein
LEPISLSAGLPSPALVVGAVLFLFLPGYAAAGWLLPAAHYRDVERLLAAPALTLALVALLTLWATVLGLPLGAPAAWALLLAALASAGAQLWVGRRRRHGLPEAVAAGGGLPGPVRIAASTLRPGAGGRDESRPRLRPGGGGLDELRSYRTTARLGSRRLVALLGADACVALAYLGLFLLALGVRLWSTRQVLPALGADTYHHTLIAALLVERGGLPDSYAPFAAIHSFAYHFGFHSLVAWLHWCTGAGVGELVGLTGHLVNAAVALGVAFFVLRALGDSTVGWLAAWLVALLCVFPPYFVNWGRFTQAGGLLLLPVAAALAVDAWTPRVSPRPMAGGGVDTLPAARESVRVEVAADGGVGLRWAGPRGALAAGLAISGLALTHYRMVAMLALLLAVWLVWEVARRGWMVDWLATGVGAMAAAVVAGALTLPWLLRLSAALGLGLGERPGDYGAEYYDLARLGSAVDQPTNAVLGMLALLGVVLAWRRGAAPVVVLAVWAAAQVALANPQWWPVALPFVGRVDLVTVLASLCFPVAVAAAYALAVGWRVARARAPDRAVVGAVGLGLAGTALGAWQLLTLVTPGNTLVTPGDLDAAAWLRANSTPDARVAPSAVIFPWAPDYVVGVDGGYWLPLLADRATTVLPMLYPGERGADPAAMAEMVGVARALRDAPSAPETAALLRARGVGYVYHSGRTGVPSLPGLLANPALREVYARDGVHVLSVAPE